MAREVWISFGVGKHHRYIAAHTIAATLGPTKVPALAVLNVKTTVCLSVDGRFILRNKICQHCCQLLKHWSCYEYIVGYLLTSLPSEN